MFNLDVEPEHEIDYEFVRALNRPPAIERKPQGQVGEVIGAVLLSFMAGMFAGYWVCVLLIK